MRNSNGRIAEAKARVQAELVGPRMGKEDGLFRANRMSTATLLSYQLELSRTVGITRLTIPHIEMAELPVLNMLCKVISDG